MAGLFDRLQDELNAREGQQPGLSPVDLLDLPSPIAAIIQKIVRKNGLRLVEIAQELNQPLADVQETLDGLVAKGFLRRVEVKQELWYKARFGRKADKPLSSGIWGALDKALGEEES